jgi:hypothetical protein
MERRLLIAFALSFLIIVLSRSLWEQPKTPAGQGAPPATPPAKRVTPPTPSTLEKAAVSAEQVAEPRKADSERLIAVKRICSRSLFQIKRRLLRVDSQKYSDSDGKPLDLILAKNADISVIR